MDSTLESWLNDVPRRLGKAIQWRAVLDAMFLLLCLRFLAAAVLSVGGSSWPAAVLLAGSLSLGLWSPFAALFAFTVAVPALNGLGQSAMLEHPFAPSLVFSALWIGTKANRLWALSTRGRAVRATASCGRGPALKSESERGRAWGDGWLRTATVIADVLATAVLASLAWQLWRIRGVDGFLKAMLHLAAPGFGDPWYFMASAFLWLQGIFYFKGLCECWGACLPDTPDAEAQGRMITAWVRASLAGCAIAMAVFVLIQLFLHVPEGWTVAGVQSPYEDISSFGSVAVALFIFAAAAGRAARPWKLAIHALACLGLLAMVLLSWSRGAWLAGLVFLLFAAYFRLSRRGAAALVLVAATAALFINVSSRHGGWMDQPYLARLASLSRFESPLRKDPERLNLYKKAGRMIMQDPLTGTGVGSFYLTSVEYGQSDDPYASQPDFAHNVILQIAAELGVPIAALFAVFVSWVLLRGIRGYTRNQVPGARASQKSLLALGATLALGAYLETQLTANSLNVYVSNQFFFWFLAASILALSSGSRERSAAPPAAPSKSEDARA